MEKPNPDENLSVDDLERQKLRLEIIDLKHQISRLGRMVKVIPVLTTLVAVGGLVFSFYNVESARRTESEKRSQESKERERNNELDRINKVQAQIRIDKEQILEFLITDKISPIKAGFLVEDLTIQTEQLPPAEKAKKEDLGQSRDEAKNAITELLRRIAWDLPFDQKRDFLFDVQALRRWNSFKQSWIDNEGSHELFLARKYFPRIQKLRAENGPCIEKLDYIENTTRLDYSKAGSPCKEDLIDALIYALRDRLKAMKLPNESKLFDKTLGEFRKFTNNPAFAKKLSENLAR